METFKPEDREEIVQRLVEWKKLGDLSWDQIADRLYLINKFARLPKSITDSYGPILVEEAKRRIKQEEDQKRGISSHHEHWFTVDSLSWQTQWAFFKKKMKPDWSEERLKKVTREASDVVNAMANPRKIDTPAKEAIRKGLVYGNVQSGKTACIAATIAMYASAGCPLILVFSGITKSLRLQTQDRLRHDLGIDDYGCYDLITAESDLIGKNAQGLAGRMMSGTPCIGVFKKSPAALRRLLKYLQSANNPTFWRGRQVLVIDDECDQYSVDVKPLYDPEDRKGSAWKASDDDGIKARSTINGLIVQILNTFERYCYVGFTATPFANVLNELPGPNSLYPADFIYPLDVVPSYYGAKKLFGSALDDPEEPQEMMDAINIVSDEDMDARENDFTEIPESLKEAFNYFVVATACKYYRNLKWHSTMLVHLDRTIVVHEQLESILGKYQQDLTTRFKQGICPELKEVWDREKDRNPFERIQSLFGYDASDAVKYAIPEYEELVSFIEEVLDKLRLVVDNSAHRMEDRLHYSKDHGDVVVVVGGNTLSRGLTLEGLLVSYFFRTSKMYDTLLQMGRWFGYRPGYEDLPRLYTTNDIVLKYAELADVEDELREQFNGYRLDVTPSDIAVKIRTLPSLQITRKKAMQSAVSTGVNYSGQRAQTRYFQRNDHQWLLRNQQVTWDFLASLGQHGVMNGQILYQHVPLDAVVQYTRDLNIHPDNRTCTKGLLLKFFKKADDRGYLKNWDVIVMSNQSGVSYEVAPGVSVYLVERSRVNTHDPSDERIYLKALQQPTNMLLDTDSWKGTPTNAQYATMAMLRHQYFAGKNEEEPGLLVIYPINKDSPYTGDSKEERLPLQAAEHVIGCMFYFPDNGDKELNNYMTIDLSGESYDEKA